MPAKSKKGRRYNWQPDLPDQRDFMYLEHFEVLEKIPTKVDLRSSCSPVFDQGKIGSCTGNALAGALEYVELLELGDKSTDDPEVFTPGHFEAMSRLFIYYNERVLEGTTNQDSGAMLRDGIKALSNWGACRESKWKYSTGQVFKKPTMSTYREAKAHLISNYYRLNSLSEMKHCLSEGFPFVLGFSVYESFETAAVAKTGILPLPGKDERLLGGHAVMAVGFNDATSSLIVRNSWGSTWGQRGYFFMPYTYVTTANLAQDFWTIRR